MLLVFLPRYGRRLLATRRPGVQIGRSLLMLASNALFVIAIARVPLATASAIGFTSPLIVTALSVPLLRESVGIRGLHRVARAAPARRCPLTALLHRKVFARFGQFGARLAGTGQLDQCACQPSHPCCCRSGVCERRGFLSDQANACWRHGGRGPTNRRHRRLQG